MLKIRVGSKVAITTTAPSMICIGTYNGLSTHTYKDLAHTDRHTLTHAHTHLSSLVFFFECLSERGSVVKSKSIDNASGRKKENIALAQSLIA